MTAERAPTLRRLLGYPPLAEAVSLTGDEGLDRPVTGIVLVDAAGTGPVRPGTIALCPAVPAGYLSSWRLDATIRRLRVLDAAALAVPSPRPGEETMLDGSRRLARHLGLPVLAVGHDPLRWAGDAAAFLYAPAVAAAELGDFQITLLVIAIAAGATVLSHVNDSGFWLVNRFFDLDLKTTLSTWTVMETTLGLSAFAIAAGLWVVA